MALPFGLAPIDVACMYLLLKGADEGCSSQGFCDKQVK